ncbi:MAG: hypothetical protein ACRCZI_05915 [Cetobacterium sp.]
MWTYEEENQLLYFVPTNFRYMPNIAIMSFNNTIVNCTMSKSKVNDMRLFSESVLPFLEKINEYGSLVIIDNITKLAQSTLRLIFGKFITLLNELQLKQSNKSVNINPLSFIIILSLTDNKFRKPYTHTFKKLQSLYISNNVENYIDLEKSIVIGNNAGRFETEVFKKDTYCYDRAFAHNIGIKNFTTPSQLFLNNDIARKWKWDNYIDITGIFELQKNIIEVPFNKIFIENKRFIIFIAGPPTSGKALLGNRISSFLKSNILKDSEQLIEIINFRHSIDQKLLQNTQKKIVESTNHLIIIDTFETELQLYKFFTKNYDHGYSNLSIKFIEMQVDINLCMFLGKFKVQISNAIIPYYGKLVYNTYKKKYKKKVFGDKLLNIDYIEYPLVLRKRPEIYYQY